MTRQLKNLAILATLAVAVSGLVYGDDDDHRGRHRDDDDRGAYDNRGAYGYGGGYSNRGAYGGNNQQYYQRAYRDGLNQGQYDRSSNRRGSYKTNEWRRGDSNYRNAYRSGYEAGYNGGGSYSNQGPYGYPNAGRSRDNYPYGNNYPSGNNSPYGNNYPYGNGYPAGRNGAYGGNAYAQGMQDGRSDGRSDMMTGHSYRPTQGDNYKHADRGYDSRLGNKDGFKQTYRSGYVNGYQQGYQRGR